MPDDQQQQQPPIDLSNPAALTAAYQQYLQYLQQVGNQRPAQAPVISQAQLDANQPTSLLGQLGEALAGGPPSDVPMTADQRERAGVRGLFNFSRGLLGTGTFDTVGQALDRGLTEAERGQYNQEAQVAYGQSAAQDWQRQQMADRLAALKESIPLLQGIQRLNMPSLYGPGGGPGAQAGTTPGAVPSLGAPIARDPKAGTVGQQAFNPGNVMADNALPPGAIGWIPAANGRKVAAYPDITTGVAGNANNLASYAGQGINTVHDAVKTWVGDPKADLTAYENAIAAKLGVKPTDKIDLTDPKVQAAFIMAQQPFESGKPWLQQSDVDKGVQLAADWRSGKVKPPSAPAQAGAPPAQPPAQPPAAPGALTAGATVTAAPSAPGVPVPPGGKPGEATGPYTGGGVGAALNPQGLPPDQAAAAAKASGRPVPILGGNGAVANPDGSVSPGPSPGMGGGKKTADILMEAVQRRQLAEGQQPPGTVLAAGPAAGTPPAPAPATAQAAEPGWGTVIGSYGGTPAAPAPQPPPGAVPPAQQPPAQQPPAQPPPQPPPGSQTAPVRDLSTLKPTDMTQPEWLQYYRHDPTPDEAARRGIILPANAPEFQQASADLDRATQLAAANRAAAQNATNMAQRGMLDQGQVAKLIQASNDADKAEEAARQKVTDLLHDTTKTNATALQKYYDDQDTANRTAYQEQVINPKAAAALAAADVNKTEIGAANSVWQKTVETANAKSGAARNVRDQLEPAMSMVGSQSTSAFIRNLLQNDPNAATYLKTLGIVDPDKVDATTALRGILSYISSEMKPTGTGALREYEFNAIQNALSSGSMSLKDQRLAMARILNLQDRIIQEGDATGELWGSAMESGNPRSGLGSIQKNIDARLGPVIHDAVKEMPAAGFDPTDINSVGKWVQSGVVRSGRPVMLPKFNDDGTVMRDRNGNIQTEMQVVK